ncbi:GTPase [Cyclospora cayetanensis]|uniref:GTPase n=1 Tax=Cyclospora cayetanensis TaxID=88456 RepID=A0A1D3D7E4_9EIME|nr:GTPase [Cyclospora cayetanensis]
MAYFAPWRGGVTLSVCGVRSLLRIHAVVICFGLCSTLVCAVRWCFVADRSLAHGLSLSSVTPSTARVGAQTAVYASGAAGEEGPLNKGLPSDKELNLVDLDSNKWLARQLHEYVQGKEAEKRREAYLLPRRKRLPLQNFHEGSTVIGKVISVFPFGCRVDVGCLDTLGLLHVRDMHFVPGALKAGAAYLQSAGNIVSDELAASETAAASSQTSRRPLTSSDATEGWIEHAEDVVKVGDLLSLRIKSIDRENRRMRLTTVPADTGGKDTPPRKLVESYWVGQEVEGIVLRRMDFGIFLDIGAEEDAFLHANELNRAHCTEDVQQLFQRFRSTRSSSRRSASPAAPPHPSPSATGGAAEALDCRAGDKLTGLRVLDIDSVRGRIQLTTRCEEELRRLQQWKRKHLGLQEEAHEESEEEKYAKIRTALKLLERQRKKQSAMSGAVTISGPREKPRTPPKGWVGRLFPEYSEEDIEEALSLLEAERRRKELLLLQEAERKARKRHPRFLRRSADDLTAKEAWQLLRKEEPGIVSEETLREDARRHAIRAGLLTAQVPVFDADGLPRLQQVPLKDLKPSTTVASSPSACPAAHAAAALASTPDEGNGESRAEPAATASSTVQSASQKECSEMIGDTVDDLEIPSEKLLEELSAYEAKQSPSRSEEGASVFPGSDSLKGEADGQGGAIVGQRRGLGSSDTKDPINDITAAELESFFAKTEADLLASLKKGRMRKDSVSAAAQREEVQELIRRDREEALKALAGGRKDAPAHRADAGDSLTPLLDDEPETPLGDVSQSEVLQTLKERLQEEPELEKELERCGETLEGMASKVQAILRHVTVPSAGPSLLGLQDELASLFEADLLKGPQTNVRSARPCRQEKNLRVQSSGHVAKAPNDEEDGGEGFVSPLFKLTEDSPEHAINMSEGMQGEEEDASRNFADLLTDLNSQPHGHLPRSAPPGRRRRHPKVARTGPLASHQKDEGRKSANSSDDWPSDGVIPCPSEKESDAFSSGCSREEKGASASAKGGFTSKRSSDPKADVVHARRWPSDELADRWSNGQKCKLKVTSDALNHKDPLDARQPLPSLLLPASSLTSRTETEPDTRDNRGSNAADAPSKRKHRGNPDIVVLPADRGTGGFHSDGPAMRPVRSLAELRKLQRQQALQNSVEQTKAQHPKKNPRQAQAQKNKPAQSFHRQILDGVRRLHQTDGG